MVMLFRTHVLFGVLVWFLLDGFIEMPLFVLFWVLLGSVFVDLDSSSSKIARKLWGISWLFKHRGVLHSLAGCFVLSLLIGVLNLWMGFGFFAGYLSHLIMDCFTFAGLKLFWPFGFRIKGFVRSGSWVEDVLFVSLLVADIWLAFISLF